MKPGIRFVARRLAALVLLLLGITFVTFVLTALVPGDPARAALGPIQGENEEAVRAWNERNGLDKPLPYRYLIYLGNLIQGDLGNSQASNTPVLEELATYIPATVELAVSSILVAGLAGVTLGVFAALHRDRLADQVLRVVSLGGMSMPAFWLALISLYLGFFLIGWFPGGGRLDPALNPPSQVTGLYTVDALLSADWAALGSALAHLALPTLVLAAHTVGYIARYTRTAVLEVIHNDYIRAAYAKGLHARTVVVGYVLRAALPSMLQILGFAFAGVLTGAVLVEKIFTWPGIGGYAYTSAITLDLPSIAGVGLFIAIVYVVVNFVVDVLYGVVDPRIRIA
ncbi:ABC transporter permease [Rhizohabitans arisaemae]|uniref:ABC transporter permease n=1 Tax=Rhizohabitans arisaemae TaxID=2720610 RepID=UPI0024B24BEE|nr:ABC transporter permease [Rhizohabitans arisaemae]